MRKLLLRHPEAQEEHHRDGLYQYIEPGFNPIALLMFVGACLSNADDNTLRAISLVAIIIPVMYYALGSKSIQSHASQFAALRARTARDSSDGKPVSQEQALATLAV